jgi:hypothetical protein
MTCYGLEKSVRKYRLGALNGSLSQREKRQNAPSIEEKEPRALLKDKGAHNFCSPRPNSTWRASDWMNMNCITKPGAIEISVVQHFSLSLTRAELNLLHLFFSLSTVSFLCVCCERVDFHLSSAYSLSFSIYTYTPTVADIKYNFSSAHACV